MDLRPALGMQTQPLPWRSSQAGGEEAAVLTVGGFTEEGTDLREASGQGGARAVLRQEES